MSRGRNQPDPPETPEASSASRVACPLPLRDHPAVILGHGGGGALSAQLVESIFLPAFSSVSIEGPLADAATVQVPSHRLALSTDSFVVQPLFFPGGNIGHLAIHGTVNDLAMMGATPLYLTVGFILEEGLPMDQLVRIAESMGEAAEQVGIRIVAGDTKVIERARGDGCYINTAGVGVLPEGHTIGPDQVRPGDVVLVSGTLGDHGMAIMSVRENLEFESPIVSDTAPLHGLVQEILKTGCDVRAMRDPTRGGLATSLHEIATASSCSIEIDETSVPVDDNVQSACEILGLDPLHVANEGKMMLIVADGDAHRALEAMKQHPLGIAGAVIGKVLPRDSAPVIVRTALGSRRIVPLPLGEMLPRIC